MPTFRIETAEGAFDVDADSEQQALQSLSDDPGFIDKAKALVSSFPPVITADVLATVGSGIVGEITAGLSGIAATALPGKPGEGAKQVESARELLRREPQTPIARSVLATVGEFIEPIVDAAGKASDESANVGALIGTVFGAPVLGETIGKIFPTALAEIVGVKGAGSLRGLKKIRGVSDAEAENLVKQGIDIDTLAPEQLIEVQQRSVLSSKNDIVQNVQKIVEDPNLTVLDEQGLFTPEAIEKLRIMDKPGVLTAEQAESFNLFQRRNIPATKADVTQDTDLQRQQQESLKRTGPVGDFVATQDTALATEVSRTIDELQPSANTAQEANANVFNSIDNFVQESEGVINKAYEVARTEAGNTPVVLLGETFDTLKQLTGPELNKPVTSQLKSIFRNRRLVNKDGSLKPISVTQAEAIRQDMNLLFDSLSPQGRRSLKQVKEAIDQDVSDVVGADVFAEARRLNTEFNNKITRSKRNRRDKRRQGFLEKIIDNTIPENEIIAKIKVQRADDVGELKNFLTEESGTSGVQAWTDIKTQIIRDALTQATGTLGKGAGGVTKFNVNKFRNSFKQLRSKGTMDIIFDKVEIDFIDDIITIGEKRVPQGIVQQGKGPSAFVVDEAIKQIPGAENIKSLAKIKQLFDEGKLLDPIGTTVNALEKQ